MNRRHLLTACAAGALAFGGPVLAQTAPRAAAAQPAPETTIGEIVVTAERREANLQDVPEAVTAFTAQDRNLKGIETVQDLTNFTPGFTYSSQLDRPAMRGLARSTNIYTADSSVAVYYDDFFSNSTFLVGRDDMLIDQVEIIEGPQGTLYGRNSIGGLINTVSKRPTDTFSGEARAIVGNYGYTKFEYTVSGPILPHLNFRLSMYDENQTQGWLKNIVPGAPGEGGVRHDPYADFQLEYKTDKDDIWVDSYVVGFNHDRGGPGSLLGTPATGSYSTLLTDYSTLWFNPQFPYGGGAVPGSVYYGIWKSTNQGLLGADNPTDSNIRTFAHSIPTDITVDKAYTFTLHWTHHFDGFDLKYIGGYSQYHYELHDTLYDNSPITQYQIPVSPACAFVGPANGIPAAVACTPLTVYPNQEFSFITDTKWSSHEIQIASNWDKPVQYIAGLYYFWETDDNPNLGQLPQQAQYKTPLAQNAAGQIVGLALPNPGAYDFVRDNQDRIQSAAAYSQVDWKITPQLKFTAGLRYTFDWKHGTEEFRDVYFGSAVPPQYFGAGTFALDISPTQISFAPAKGVCGLPVLQTSGRFEGDWTRCLSDHSSALTGTAGVEWTPNDTTLIYARYNRGYKAFAFYSGYINSQPEAAPEHVDDVEIGYKGTISHNLTIDIDGFYYNYVNDQIPIGHTVVGANNQSTTVTQFVNVPKAVSDGVEMEIYWRPIRHLDLSFTYGLDHTEILTGCNVINGVPTGACYEDTVDPFAAFPTARPVLAAGQPTNTLASPCLTTATCTVEVQSVKGNELPQAPEHKIALNGVYTFNFDAGDLILSATYVWKAKSFSSLFNQTYDEAPSWYQVDMRATWRGPHDRYEIIAYVRNLTNSIGYDAAGTGFLNQFPASSPNSPYTAGNTYDLTPPRTFGVEFHYKF